MKRESAKVIVKEPIMKSLKQLLKNKNYILVAHSFALIYSCVAVFGQEMAFLVSPFGFVTVFFI